jgi:CRISPR/Cas system-associated exonuclease Cas4 (RecB family)
MTDWDALYKNVILTHKASRSFSMKGKIFPSSGGVGCELKLNHLFIGTEEKKQYNHHGIEDRIGNAIHREIQNAMKLRFGDNVEVEKPISYTILDLQINGKVDLVLKNQLIIEIKTVKSSEGKSPEAEHIKQVQWYMGVLGLKKAVISYFNRENGIHLNTFEVTYDEKVFEYIKGKFQRVIEGRGLKSDIRECKFCPFSWTCEQYKPPQWSKKKDESE